MKVELRKASISDCEEISRLQSQWTEENITHGYMADTVEALKDKINEFCYVAEIDGCIVGFLLASIHEAKEMAVMSDGERYIEFEDIFVCNGYRDQGVGSFLLDRALEEARAHGVERAMVYSASKDLDSIMSFYRRHGFKSWYVQMFK